MKTDEKLTSELKFRVTDTQKTVIMHTAEKEMLSTSDFLRHLIFDADPLSAHAAAVRCNLARNEIHNRIQASDKIPDRYKKELLKEIM